MTTAVLSSWGRYPNAPQQPTYVHWQNDLPTVLREMRNRYDSTLPYGAGLSYGDSCLAASSHVLQTGRLNRFLLADWESGILRAESGVTLAEILEVAIPRGWFLSVTPGTKFVTLGGAIANDVHGKNHHRRGTFGCHVRQFSLIRSDRDPIICSPAQHCELFQATIGGLGLTGVIGWAEIQLVQIRSSAINSVTTRFSSLDEFFAISDEFDARHEFSVSWVDCRASGRTVGRGVYMAGDFATEGTLQVERPPRVSVPVTPPISLINSASLAAFNAVYYRKAPVARRYSTGGYNAFFYPLDAIRHWNRIYGQPGFQQYQALIPSAHAREGIQALLKAIAQSGTGSFLAVLKRCGSHASPGILSFPQAGTTLALDFPQHDRLGRSLFPRLDGIVRELNGRQYPAKDAHMAGEDFRSAYPNWEVLESFRDPALLSEFWRRVTQ